MKRIYNNSHRPITKTRTTITIDKDLLKIIKEIAKKENRKVSNYVTYAVTEHTLKHYKEFLTNSEDK